MTYKVEVMCYHIDNDNYFLSVKDKKGNVIEAEIDKENARQIIETIDNKII